MALSKSDTLRIIFDFCQEGQLSVLLQSLRNLRGLEHAVSDIVVWDSQGQSNLEKVFDSVIKTENRLPISVVRRTCSVLESLKELTDILSTASIYDVFIADSAVLLTEDLVRHFVEKRLEYKNEILCTSGSRFFPHAPLEDPVSFWKDGKFKRTYKKHDKEDRQVHVFNFKENCVLFSVNHLKALSVHSPPDGVSVCGVADYWLSFVACHDLELSIWKIELPEELEIPHSQACSHAFLRERTQLYLHHTQRNWPPNILSPLLPSNLHAQQVRSTSDIWKAGFRGLNMSSRPMPLDYAAARYYGASVIRIGATDGTHDLSYIANNTATADDDKATLTSGMPILRYCIQSAADVGLKVIITLINLPGRRFLENDHFELWDNFAEYSHRIASLWGRIAEGLLDLRHHIAGYDVINEPSTPTDKTLSSECPLVSDVDTNRLGQLYDSIINAIRENDSETTIILESSYWASPRTFPLLKPVADENVVYSFHFYEPKIYTDRLTNPGKFSYPGGVPPYTVMEKWPESWVKWDRERIEETLLPVARWQHQHGIAASRIFVGEFGVCRDVPGAAKYLADVTSAINAHGWSWCAFSFRDDEWDAMDYELGEDVDNQLCRMQTNIFSIIANQLK